MGTVHTVAVHFRYDYYMRRLANEFLCRNPIRLSTYNVQEFYCRYLTFYILSRVFGRHFRYRVC